MKHERMNENYTDEYLMLLMKQDIEQGTSLVMEQYAGLIWTVCSNYLQNPEDIKECVNDTFAEFVLNYERFKSNKGSLKNYLCKIAEHCAVDKFRDNMREKQREDTMLEKMSLERMYGTDKKEEELLEDALDQLTPIDNQILRMKFYDGLSFKEVAEKLHMDYEVVKKRSQRSYNKLLKIILLGLLLGILAACAAIVFQQYRFSELTGFIWNVEDIAYRIEEKTDSVEVDGISYMISDAVYYDDKFQVELIAKWLGVIEPDSKEQFYNKITDFIGGNPTYNAESGVFQHYEESPLEIDDVERYGTSVLFEMSIINLGDAVAVRLDYDTILKSKEKDEIHVAFILKSGIEFEIDLKPIPIEEYEKTENEIELSDGSAFVLGPNYVGDDNVVVSLYHAHPQDYEIAPLISNNYKGMGTWSSKTQNVVLIDREGNQIPTQRIKSEDNNDNGFQRNFQLFFPRVENGIYTLQIPYLCLLKDESSKEISFDLPTVEGTYKEFNTEVLFPDGSGYRILEIRCEKNTFAWENYVENVPVIVEETEWQYYITYETISTSNIEFCFAELQGVIDDGTKTMGLIDNEGNYYFSIKESSRPVAKQPKSVEIQFRNPVYVLDEKISIEIALESE